MVAVWPAYGPTWGPVEMGGAVLVCSDITVGAKVSTKINTDLLIDYTHD